MKILGIETYRRRRSSRSLRPGLGVEVNGEKIKKLYA